MLPVKSIRYLFSPLRSTLLRRLSEILRWLYPKTIAQKPIKGYRKTLYYEKGQHLTFPGQREIHYEPSIRQAIMPLIPVGGLVFDIGANIGQYTVIFSERVGESGRVIAVEPDYKNFAFLQFNVLINRCGNVQCLLCGLGAHCAELPLYRDTLTGGRRSAFKEEWAGSPSPGCVEKVPVRTLDNLIATYGEPAFVKIDAEGSEADILRGLSTDLAGCVFLVEVRRETAEEVWAYFARRGYRCVCVEMGNAPVRRPEDIPGFAHLLFQKG